MTLRTLKLPVVLAATWDNLAWPDRSPADDLEYQVDATDWLADAGLSIVGCDVACSPGLSVSAPVVQGGVTTMRIAGGAPDTTAVVRLLLHLSGDEELEIIVGLRTRPAAPDGLIGPMPIPANDTAPLIALVL